jgi:mono/diheme cytochrome c family protein
MSGKNRSGSVRQSFISGGWNAARSAALAAIGAGMVFVSSLPLAAQDASDIAEGARIFRQKGNCQSCHGWAGDGRKMDSQMPDGAKDIHQNK